MNMQEQTGILFGPTAKNSNRYIVVLVLLTLIVFPVSLCIGRYNVPFQEVAKIIVAKFVHLEPTWTVNMENVVLRVRLPRLCAAFLVGGALSLSGATYQGMFSNPLVSPDLLGVSAGACVGASIAILNHSNAFGIQLSAFIFGLLAVFLTCLIPKLFKIEGSLMLVLAGIIISGFFNSIQGIIKYVADPESELAEITYWTMGSISKVKISDILMITPAMLLAGGILLALRWRINILSLGDKEAKSLGMNVSKFQRLAIICATVLTACSVCISGTIGWVGLIIPHLGRLLIGPDNTHLLPATVLLGAIFLIIVDTLARNLIGAEIYLSILTGLVGAPLYTWMLIKERARIT
jgi:iron complex transport system permease protein